VIVGGYVSDGTQGLTVTLKERLSPLAVHVTVVVWWAGKSDPDGGTHDTLKDVPP